MPDGSSETRFKQDISLLKEYGFKARTMGSVPMNTRKIEHFGMRQLDRLKMLLLRNEAMIEHYPERVRKGIERNDIIFFATGLALLSPQLRDAMH
jgi:hypothetical protein